MRHRKQTRKSREALPKAHNATRIPVKAQAQLVAVKAQAQLLVVKAQAQLLVVKAQAHLVAPKAPWEEVEQESYEEPGMDYPDDSITSLADLLAEFPSPPPPTRARGS
ncbi:hypothetical protein AB1Y20_012490 [Prymnesium parvum]|uniref:Uncharacterized protein n=1 Tax=Prymnesium parvum TaxID=97485 RepID=A0AB34IKT4_PRYPA